MLILTLALLVVLVMMSPPLQRSYRRRRIRSSIKHSDNAAPGARVVVLIIQRPCSAVRATAMGTALRCMLQTTRMMCMTRRKRLLRGMVVWMGKEEEEEEKEEEEKEKKEKEERSHSMKCAGMVKGTR